MVSACRGSPVSSAPTAISSRSLYGIFTNPLLALYEFSDVIEPNTNKNYSAMPLVPSDQIAQSSFREEDRTSDQRGIKLEYYESSTA